MTTKQRQVRRVNRFAIRTKLVLGGAILLTLFISWLTIAQETNGQNGSCHLRELDLCAASMVVFAQNPNGLATSDTEINKQCVHLKEAEKCVKNYLRRCMMPIQRDVVMLAANSSFQLLDEYCSKGSKFRQSYLKHAQCMNQVHKRPEQRGCIRDLQVALEAITSNELSPSKARGKQSRQIRSSNATTPLRQGDANGKRLSMSCCAMRRLETCMGSQTEKRCGKETIQFVQSAMRRATSRLPDVVCRNFKPDGPECRAILPKEGQTPRGSKSSSIISRLLSAYTGL